MIPSDPFVLIEKPMSTKPIAPSFSPSPVPLAAGAALGAVKVVKREAKEPSRMREKVCATCGRTFELEPDQKFFNCPECYRRSLPVRRASRRSEAQILAQITCVECGAVEYLDFVPPDLNATYCHSCFAKRRQELQAARVHT
jgi:DNA-directed RNA polymerase subunit RPC12/RpoP